jgi:hypothetical protein
MRNKEKISYAVLLMIALAGYIIHGYWGGVISGAGLGIMIIALIGKKISMAAVRRIDKRIKDILIEEDD